MKKSVLLTLLFFLIAGNVHAQSGGKIVGQVIDSRTNEPLIGCNIVIEGMQLGAATDQDGIYTILDVIPGEYDITAIMIGYQQQKKTGVRVVSGLTTKLNFELSEEALESEAIVVESFKSPPVQKDLTHKVQATTAEELARIPVTTIDNILAQKAGVVRQIRTSPVSSLPVFGQFNTIPTDGFHVRGGRENEQLYLLDGFNVSDALWGGYSLEQLGELSISSLETYTGTFGPEYGDAMSGVIIVNTKDKFETTPKFSIKAYTDNHGINAASQNTYSGEFFLSSAIPGTNNLGLVLASRSYSTDGYIFGYVYPEYVNSNGLDKSGKPEKVPMQYLDTQFNFGKLVWRPSSSFNIALGGYIAATNQGVYNHYFKYNPYGTPQVQLDDYLAYLKVKYAINENSFVNVKLGNYHREFLSEVYDDPALYELRSEISTNEFSVAGEDYVRFSTLFDRMEAGFDYVLQLDRIQNISAGFTYNQLETNLSRRNPNGNASLENYKYKPVEMHGYLKDKLEFEDMGMIINAGLRFDYIDQNRKVLVNFADLTDLQAPLENFKPEIYVTPRFGISFPVAEKAAVRFGYGHYYQYPDYYKVFQGVYLSDLTGEYRPNPGLDQSPIAQQDIKPEETVNYEAGVQVKITDEISADVTGFYRKTKNLIGVLFIDTSVGSRKETLGNIDFATVKGLELSLKKSFSNNLSASLNYTYSQALVSTSVLFTRPNDESRTFPANWDQPHIVNANVYFEADNGFGFSLYGSASSGYPYTRPGANYDLNGDRSPWIHQLDMNIFKNFSLYGFKQQLFVQVLNVPNRKNVWWVYADSGIPGDDANEATSHDYTNNPSMYGPGRTIQVGFKIWN
ncbi:MAG: TonB-dependent receptor [Calditrichaeota bacterium]|nr:TonB-dependent receptor [Calditrichota bacterium]